MEQAGGAPGVDSPINADSPIISAGCCSDVWSEASADAEADAADADLCVVRLVSTTHEP